MARIENGEADLPQIQDHPIDDLGTNQAEASHILQEIRDAAFDASDEKLALALGRPTEEIEEWTSGAGLIDGDVATSAAPAHAAAGSTSGPARTRTARPSSAATASASSSAGRPS